MSGPSVDPAFLVLVRLLVNDIESTALLKYINHVDPDTIKVLLQDVVEKLHLLPQGKFPKDGDCGIFFTCPDGSCAAAKEECYANIPMAERKSGPKR